jgi:Arc/MetJ-type ribon-helix-helix transcriptional regulator
MDWNLPAEANDFVRSLVAQGKYQSEVDAVVDGIRFLKGREELRAKMAVGISQLRLTEASLSASKLSALSTRFRPIFGGIMQRGVSQDSPPGRYTG